MGFFLCLQLFFLCLFDRGFLSFFRDTREIHGACKQSHDEVTNSLIPCLLVIEYYVEDVCQLHTDFTLMCSTTREYQFTTFVQYLEHMCTLSWSYATS